MNESLNTDVSSILKYPNVAKNMPKVITNILLSPQSQHMLVSLCKSYNIICLINKLDN